MAQGQVSQRSRLGASAYLPRGGSYLRLLHIVVALAVTSSIEQLVDGSPVPGLVQMVEVVSKALPSIVLFPRVERFVGLVGSVNQAETG